MATSWPGLHADRIGVADAGSRVVAEADRAALRLGIDRPARSSDDRMPPAGDAHRAARVGDHAEARQRGPAVTVGSRQRRRCRSRQVRGQRQAARRRGMLLLRLVREAASAHRHRSPRAGVRACAGCAGAQPQLVHQRQFPWRAGAARLPSPGPGGRTRRRAWSCGSARRVAWALASFGGIDVLVAVPEPLVSRSNRRRRVAGAHRLRQQTVDQDRLVEPGGEDRIEDHAAPSEPGRRGSICNRSGGRAGRRRSCSPSEFPAATLNGMFRQRAISLRISLLELGIGRRPAARRCSWPIFQPPGSRQQRAALELDRVDRLDRDRLSPLAGASV